MHKLLEENSWIFGEEFHLTNSDETLTNVLRKCRESEGLDPSALDPVIPVSGKSREIIDLALCRRIPLPNGDRHHLVVELKAPKVSLDDKVLTQTKGYAYSVAADERFQHTKTRWTFWMVSNTMSYMMEMEIDQDGRDFGQVYKKKNIEIWALTWGQLFERCYARMKFFQDSLEYSPSTETALSYLNRVYGHFVPDAAKTK